MNKKRLAEWLTRQGADINCKIMDGNTPLTLVTKYCGSALMKLLIAYGAEVNEKRNDGEMPLSLVYREESTKKLELFIDVGVSVYGNTINDLPPFFFTCNAV